MSPLLLPWLDPPVNLAFKVGKLNELARLLRLVLEEEDPLLK